MLQTNAYMQKLSLPRELQTATMVYKSLNGLAPDYLKSMFTARRSTSTYSLRNCEGKLAIPLPCTNFLKKKISYSGAVLWNSSPTNLRQAQTLASFKSGCRRFLFDNDLRVNHTAFMESRHFVMVFIFVVVRFFSRRLASWHCN